MLPRSLVAAIVAVAAFAAPNISFAEPVIDTPVAQASRDAAAPLRREKLGVGRLFNNDFFGDTQDRWRTGSYSISYVKGYGWDGVLPQSFGDILEFRFRSSIIAPANLENPVAPPDDRPYAGSLSFGLHSHWQNGPYALSAGADLVVTGPQTGLSRFHGAAHEALGMPAPGDLSGQVPNGFHPKLTAEVGREYRLNRKVALRPFAEVTAGPENILRVGGDMMVGRSATGQLMIRDAGTGQRYQATRFTPERGFSFVLGGDMAYVDRSIYLPASSGLELTPIRARLRSGVHWQGKKAAAFAGVTWLGREFETQPEGQFVGSLRLRLRF